MQLPRIALACALALLGCDGAESTSDAGPGTPGFDAGPGGSTDAGPASGTDAGPASGSDAGAPVASRDLRCSDAPPPGATMPPPLPAYTGGTCPSLSPGYNTITSSGSSREFLLVTPSDMRPDERLPVIVMWHHLGGDANSLLSQGAAQEAADELRFIAAIPEKKGDLTINVIVDEFDMVWPYLNQATMPRMEEEAVFFDDMVTCIAQQYSVEESCISTAGISAGALWSAQLLQMRSERLASAIILSGGVGPATTNGFIDVQGWRGADHRAPVLLAWGGPTDQCGADFHRASNGLGSALASNGHFVEECVHNCGHAAPPVDPAVGLPVLWRFALDHPYWLEDGESPYLAVGLPEGTPTWCATGHGTATPRTGMCTDSMACPVGAL